MAATVSYMDSIEDAKVVDIHLLAVVSQIAGQEIAGHGRACGANQHVYGAVYGGAGILRKPELIESVEEVRSLVHHVVKVLTRICFRPTSPRP